MENSRSASIFFPRSAFLFFLCIILVGVTCISVYLGFQRPWQSAATQLEVIKANGVRLLMMISAGVALFFSVVFFAKGLSAIRWRS